MPRWVTALVLASAFVGGLAAPARADTISYLDDGVVRVGVDLDRGGLIVYLAPSGTDPRANLVDATIGDEGIQPWFQAGPDGFDNPAPPYQTNPWNPSLGGDAFGNQSWVDRYGDDNDGTTIHTETYPLQWALSNTSCTCVIEQWITLDGAAVKVRMRLELRYDHDVPAALREQQLPALHLDPKLNRLFAYTGDQPFREEPLTLLGAVSARQSVTSAERWAALVDANGSGVGVIASAVARYDFAAGFLAPVAVANLDTNSAYPGSVYEADATIVLGTVAQIRAYAQAHRPEDTRPDYQFTSDHRHWSLWNMAPPKSSTGVLDAVPGDDPQLLGPDEWFQAVDVPTLYVRGAWHTHDNLAQLFWRSPSGGWSEAQSVRFRVIPDGRFHSYAVRLSGQPLWSGTITQLRLDPVCCAEPNAVVDLASLSWRPDPGAMPVAIEHARGLDLHLVRDRRHRLGATGKVVIDDAYLPCLAGVPVRLQQRARTGQWVTVRTLFTGIGGQFSLTLPPKSHAYFRAVVDEQTAAGNTCDGAVSHASKA